MQDQILNMLLKEDEITWQTIIQDLIKSEQMSPWDINISLLSQKYLETIRTLKEHNFFVSGKVILASAILLRLKSYKLVDEDIANLDSFLFDQDVESLLDFPEDPNSTDFPDQAILIPRLPQPRKRKVTIEELMSALNKALEVKKRRILRNISDAPQVDIPQKKVDIAELIKDIYGKIISFFQRTMGKEPLTFSKLVPSEKREDKIYTFIPLLHLDNQEKISLDQKEHFGEIEIKMPP
ncbi:MAG: segregation/condensation protein A [Candidatus Woesearchaeota archaeon]|nr:MAG: segregation/condensation protein A [Candidatus Woesearchaeota archaeon]